MRKEMEKGIAVYRRIPPRQTVSTRPQTLITWRPGEPHQPWRGICVNTTATGTNGDAAATNELRSLRG